MRSFLIFVTIKLVLLCTIFKIRIIPNCATPRTDFPLLDSIRSFDLSLSIRSDRYLIQNSSFFYMQRDCISCTHTVSAAVFRASNSRIILFLSKKYCSPCRFVLICSISLTGCADIVITRIYRCIAIQVIALVIGSSHYTAGSIAGISHPFD